MMDIFQMNLLFLTITLVDPMNAYGGIWIYSSGHKFRTLNSLFFGAPLGEGGHFFTHPIFSNPKLHKKKSGGSENGPPPPGGPPKNRELNVRNLYDQHCTVSPIITMPYFALILEITALKYCRVPPSQRLLVTLA